MKNIPQLRRLLTIKRPSPMPHTGKKEQERAKRCYMEHHFPPVMAEGEPYYTYPLRSAPVMLQMSKKQYTAWQEQAVDVESDFL